MAVQNYTYDGYNPFVDIRPEHEGYEERIQKFVDTIALNSAERIFLQAIVFFICDGFIVAERNMSTVIEIINLLQNDRDKYDYDSDLDIFVKIFEGEHGSNHIGVRLYKRFRFKLNSRTAKTIAISVAKRLAPFDKRFCLWPQKISD